jgi:hypothetical protein
VIVGIGTDLAEVDRKVNQYERFVGDWTSATSPFP